MQLGPRLLVLSLVLFWLPRAHADELDVDFRGPPSCPDAASVDARVRELLTGKVHDEHVEARARVRRHKRVLTLDLRISVDGRAAHRTLHAPDCRILAETAAWLIAVAIDPTVAPPSSKPEPAPAPEPVPEPTPAPEPAPEPEPEPVETPAARPEPAPVSRPEPDAEPDSPPPPLAGRLGLLGGLSSDGLGGPHATLGARAGLSRGLWYGELRFLHAFQRTEALTSQAGEVRFSGQSLALVGCAEWGDRLRAGPCLELAAQRTAGRTEDLVNPTKGGVFWANVGLGAQARGAVWRQLELGVSGALAIPLTARPELSVDGGDDAFTVSYLTIHVELGLSYRLR